MWILVILYLLLCAADIFITLKAVKHPWASEMNPLMRLCLKNRNLFYAAQAIINGFALFVTIKFGLVLAVTAVIFKGYIVIKNYIIWQDIKKKNT